MKRISLTIALLTCFAVNLMAVPAAPFLITLPNLMVQPFKPILEVMNTSAGLKLKINRFLSKAKPVVTLSLLC